LALDTRKISASTPSALSTQGRSLGTYGR